MKTGVVVAIGFVLSLNIGQLYGTSTGKDVKILQRDVAYLLTTTGELRDQISSAQSIQQHSTERLKRLKFSVTVIENRLKNAMNGLGKEKLIIRETVADIRTDMKGDMANMQSKLEGMFMRIEEVKKTVNQNVKRQTASDEEMKKQLHELKEQVRILILTEEGWLQYGHSMYRLFTTKKTFQSATNACNKIEASLVEEPDEDEMKFLYKNFGKRERYWLGASDREIEGKWMWLSGRQMTYERWGRGQPDDYLNGQNCLLSGSVIGDHWDDGVCTGRINYVCVKKF